MYAASCFKLCTCVPSNTQACEINCIFLDHGYQPNIYLVNLFNFFAPNEALTVDDQLSTKAYFETYASNTNLTG